ncbi:PC-esterase domain-containing protein 1B-like [Eublepharis macularius]|uniref:PC-esterase domain-containing protein 1B-like n=1 Tax=Eublepharis macularius TaxID=481883 RepID=A0AA97JX96_EUBMA|nr:PC-esterase domain-containing protein 1B-like [Eublepharis macularius]XP_054846247.1 PC-esterase domain-containing protein 1B-like [Eublepharis macularius]XP_054846248.1 PC-esterase domain-containing protein 1B-like [Eublepharis macularius]
MVDLPLRDFHNFSSKEVQQLLHNKFVVILGDSIHRTIYKDLVRFLQDDGLLTFPELIVKGAVDFWNDQRVEGGKQHQETDYQEVRQYRTDHHLVRAYFITRIYSRYMESILDDFKAGPSPDLVILNSCIWDLNRYLDWTSNEHPLKKAFREYRQNLRTLFQKLHDILPSSCLIIWDTVPPIAPEIKIKKMKNEATPVDVLRANFDSATLACCYKLDVLDLNFCFRFLEQHRADDGVHWNAWVHRCITKLLLTHVADAWGVELVKKRPRNGITWNGNAAYWHRSPRYWPRPLLPRSPLYPHPQPTFPNGQPMVQFNFSQDLSFQHDNISDWGPSSGFYNFEDDHEPPACQEEVQHGNFHGPIDAMPNGVLGIPPPPVELVPNEGWGHPSLPVDHMPNGGWRDNPPLPVDNMPNGGWRDNPPLSVDVAPNEGFLPPIPVELVPNGGWGQPPLPVDGTPNGGWRGRPPFRHRSPRGFRSRRRNGRVMHQRRFYTEHYRPYGYPPNGPGGYPPFQDPSY